MSLVSSPEFGSPRLESGVTEGDVEVSCGEWGPALSDSALGFLGVLNGVDSLWLAMLNYVDVDTLMFVPGA